MADENINNTPNYGELINNMKAESDRKLSNLEQSIAAQLSQLPTLIQQSVSQYVQPAQQQQTADTSMDIYDNPEGFVNNLKTEIAQAVSQQVSSTIANYENSTVKKSQLYSEFPELSDPNHEVTQAVIARFQALTPAQKKDSDQHLSSIVYQVASEKGLRPKSYRQDDDSFSLSGERGERNVAPGKDPDKLDGINKGTQAWAEILKEIGAPIDITKPEDKAKLQEYAKRRNWTSLDQSPTFKRGGNR